MRIAYICSDHGIPVLGAKGASIHIQELVNAFDGLGHDVDLLCARVGPGEPRDIAAPVTKVHPETAAVRTLGGNGADGAERRFKEQRFVKIAHAMEASIVERHGRTPFDFIYERFSLWSAAGVRAARRLGIPCIVEVNAPLRLEQERYRKLAMPEVARTIESEVFENADALVCVSQGVRDYTLTGGARVNATHVIPNGVDPARFHPDVEPCDVAGLGSGPVIGFVGSLKPWHGVQDLLEAFRLVHAKIAGARLLIVGDGPLRSWIDGFAHGAGLTDEIVVTGWTPYGELPSLIRRMDITTAPYPELDDFYFSPLKLFEYLAVGRPVVASATGQVSEIINDGVNGLLCRPGQPQELADAIHDLLHDTAARDRLAAAAADSARNYTWLSNASRVLELAADVMQSRQPARQRERAAS